jgi:putative transposase
MSRYRLYPTKTQEVALLGHCASARFVWNLATEQRSWWQPGRGSTPGFSMQCRQLTDARAAFPWLAEGSIIVQQQALRDFHQAWSNYVAALRTWRVRVARLPTGEHPSPPGPPSWRKRGRDEGFRVVAVEPGEVRRLNWNWGAVKVPKLGWVRFRWSRAVPAATSYRVTCDRAGRWHVAFAAVPPAIPAPGNGRVVGVDRGVTVSAALSTGELLAAPSLRPAEARRMRLLQRRLARATRGSNRRARVKRAVARLYARAADRRTNWVEQTSTDLARRFDTVRVEDLDVQAMTRSAKGTVERPGKRVRQKAGLNRGILGQGWGRVVTRLEQKAPGRVEKTPAAFTSQRCHVCGHVAAESRKGQAFFACVACAWTGNADVNAACNIAAGRAVPVRGGSGSPGPKNREPHHVVSSAA